MAPRARRGGNDDEPPAEVAGALAEAKRQALGHERWPLERWYKAISRMRRLSQEFDLGLHDPNEPNVFDLPHGPGLEGGVGHIGRETVRVIERFSLPEVGLEDRGPVIIYPDTPQERFALHRVGYLINRHDLPVMIISLEASDEHILAEVERILHERAGSKASKGLPRKPGRRSLSPLLQSGQAWKKWQKHRIVELVEMLAWNSADGRQYPKHRIGFWIDASKLGTSKDTSEAIAIARKAISALPEIMAEVSKTRLPG